MKLRDRLANGNLSQLEITLGFLEAERESRRCRSPGGLDPYVEMLTRILTQPLPAEDGDEQAALYSNHSLFSTKREILRARGPGATEFAKLAIVALDQIVRPFTAKSHRLGKAGAFAERTQCRAFRFDLANLADVEDPTGLQADPHG